VGEFQNHAVKALQLVQTKQSFLDPAERRKRFLENVVRLYLAIGGRLEDFRDLSQPVKRVDQLVAAKEIGSLVVELSALSSLHDLDMMQAAKIELEMLKAKNDIN
jgi:hypothetical protein